VFIWGPTNTFILAFDSLVNNETIFQKTSSKSRALIDGFVKSNLIWSDGSGTFSRLTRVDGCRLGAGKVSLRGTGAVDEGILGYVIDLLTWLCGIL